MRTQQTVAVVIPAYNAARTIAPCVEACLAQDDVDVEVIVVDDGADIDMALARILRGEKH